jgi:serine protease AprX
LVNTVTTTTTNTPITGNSGWSGLGTVLSPALSKNALTIGASESEHDAGTNRTLVASWSSLGPTPDGRIKPDVVAP